MKIFNKSTIKKYYSLTYELIERIDGNHLFLLSSGIAFNIALYIIPMILVSLYIFNQFVVADDIVVKFEAILMDMLPPTGQADELIKVILKEVKGIMSNSSTAGWIGFATLLWLSSTLISSIRTGLNAIFKITTPKIFVFYRIKDIFIIIILTILVILYSYAVPLLSLIASFLESFVPDVLQGMFSNVMLTGVALATSYILFNFIYLFVPTKRLPKFVRRYSSIICVIMIEISRHIFGWYVTSVTNYGKVYGAYAVFVSMALWIYYSAFIMLFSAELMKFIHDKREERKLQIHADAKIS